MIIKKNENEYVVEELKDKWKVSKTEGKLDVAYDVPKDLCPDIESLKKHIITNDLF